MPAASSLCHNPSVMLEAEIQTYHEDSELLSTTSTGRLWRERTFYREVWRPAQEPLASTSAP